MSFSTFDNFVKLSRRNFLVGLFLGALTICPFFYQLPAAKADDPKHYFRLTREGGVLQGNWSRAEMEAGRKKIGFHFLPEENRLRLTIPVFRFYAAVGPDYLDNNFWGLDNNTLYLEYQQTKEEVRLGNRAVRFGPQPQDEIKHFSEGEYTLFRIFRMDHRKRTVSMIEQPNCRDIHICDLEELTGHNSLSWGNSVGGDNLTKLGQNKILLDLTPDNKYQGYFVWYSEVQKRYYSPRHSLSGNEIKTVIELLYYYTTVFNNTTTPYSPPIEFKATSLELDDSSGSRDGPTVSQDGSSGSGDFSGDSSLTTASPLTKGLAGALESQDFFVRGTWQITRGTINVLLIIALLLIAFTNILRLNLESYTVKKALPNLILGVILANASYLIIRYLVDVVTVTTHFFVNLARFDSLTDLITRVGTTVGVDSIRLIFNITPSLGALTNASFSVAAIFAAIILAIISAIVLLWLAFLLYFRLVMVYLLTVLSPLAFVAYGIPGLEKYFKMWWQQMIKWLFMVPAMVPVFWLIIRITENEDISLAKMILAYALLFFALSLPSKMGGAIIDKASGVFKKGVNAAYGGSQSFGLQAGLWGRSLAEKDNPALKGLGKVLQHGGHVIASPTALKRGLKRRMEGVAKGREYEMKQGWAYKRAAGGQARFMDKYSKAMEDYRGLDAKSLAQIMTGFDPDTGENKNQKMLDWLGKLSILERHQFLTTDFNAWRTTNKKGLPASEEEMADFAVAARLFNTESMRRTQKVGGVEALFDAGWDFDQFKKNQVAAASSASSPYGDVGSPINTSIATEIEERLKKGHLAETISNEISQKYGLDKLTALGAVNDINLALRLRPLIEHFRPDPGLAQSIAKMGAELGEEFEEALAKNTDPAFEQVIERGREFLHKAGASIGFSADIPGQTNFDQVSELQRRVAEVTRAAHSASMGYSAETSTKIANVFNQTGFRLGELAPDGGPAVAATHFQNDQQAQTVINNHIVSQAKAQNVLLNPNQVQQISQTLKTDLIQELSNNKTLTRIFGSEKFRQKIIEAVSNAQPNIDVIAPQPGDARPNEPQYTQQQPPTQ